MSVSAAILMVSTLVRRRDADSISILDSETQIKPQCYLNGRVA
jgi:hypothetical protein